MSSMKIKSSSFAEYDSRYMDELDEEEQLRHIYSPHLGSRPNSNNISNEDDIISQSPTMSFEIDAILKQHWLQIKCYVCFKAIVWLFIGAIIFYTNYTKQDTLTAFVDNENHNITRSPAQSWCCDCLHFAKTSPLRIDWSYCAGCVNCTACLNQQTIFSNQCDGMGGLHNQHKEPDCHLQGHILSDTTMSIFYKNYHAYGWGALITCLIYVGITMLVFVVDNTKHQVDTIGMLLMVYNIVVSMVCFYMIYKPYQYQKRVISKNKTDPNPFCYVDTLGHKMEDALSVFIFGSLMLMIFQWLFCCCKCATKRRRKENLNCVTSASERLYVFTTLFFGIGFFITMFTAVGFLISYVIEHRDVSFRNENNIKWLFIVDAVLIICCMDIFCCPFCGKRVKDCCKARNIRIKYQKKTYGNIHHKESLLTAQSLDLDDVDNDRY